MENYEMNGEGEDTGITAEREMNVSNWGLQLGLVIWGYSLDFDKGIILSLMMEIMVKCGRNIDLESKILVK